jgi:hypothetical protein
MLAARFVPGLVSLPLNLRNLSNLWINSALLARRQITQISRIQERQRQLES